MAGVGQVSSHGGESWGAGGSLALRPPQGPQEQGWPSSAEQSILLPLLGAGRQGHAWEDLCPNLPPGPPAFLPAHLLPLMVPKSAVRLTQQGWGGWWLWPGGQVRWGEVG